MMPRPFALLALAVLCSAGAALARVNFTDDEPVVINGSLFLPADPGTNYLDPTEGSILPETEAGQWLSTGFSGSVPGGVDVWFYIGDDSFEDPSGFAPGQFAIQFSNTQPTAVTIDASSFRIVISGLVSAEGQDVTGFTPITSDGTLASDLQFSFSHGVLTVAAGNSFVMAPGEILNISGDFAVVPEPSTLALAAVAGAILVCSLGRRRWSRVRGL
jgi:hypothetical protein